MCSSFGSSTVVVWFEGTTLYLLVAALVLHALSLINAVYLNTLGDFLAGSGTMLAGV